MRAFLFDAKNFFFVPRFPTLLAQVQLTFLAKCLDLGYAPLTFASRLLIVLTTTYFHVSHAGADDPLSLGGELLHLNWIQPWRLIIRPGAAPSVIMRAPRGVA